MRSQTTFQSDYINIYTVANNGLSNYYINLLKLTITDRIYHYYELHKVSKSIESLKEAKMNFYGIIFRQNFSHKISRERLFSTLLFRHKDLTLTFCSLTQIQSNIVRKTNNERSLFRIYQK